MSETRRGDFESGRKGGKIMAGDRDITPLVDMHERVVAQEAYNPLKMAIEIIGLLNTAIPRGYEEVDQERRRKNLRRDIAELENPFDSEDFRAQLERMTKEFSQLTDSNAVAASQIYDLIDTDIAHRRLPNARAKITDLSLYFMDQTKNFMKRQYPW